MNAVINADPQNFQLNTYSMNGYVQAKELLYIDGLWTQNNKHQKY